MATTATRSARVRALAKLNLALKILHRRPDGYHELRTVYQTISLADRIEIEFSASRRTEIALESTIEIPDNLVLRAARLALDRMKITARVRMRLAKRIPMGAGLGGGSADAAAVLLALPVLAGRRLQPVDLVEIASGLGSDVPFFLVGGTALGVGRGAEIYPLADFPLRDAVVVCPDLHVSTAEAYRALGRGELTSESEFPIINSFQCRVWNPAGGLSVRGSAFCENDFEGVVFVRHPELATLRSRLLRTGALAAMLTGSGAALFGLFQTREQAKAAAERMHGVEAFPVRLVGRRGYQSLWWSQLRKHVNRNLWPPQSRYAR